jgi:N-acetyl-alpha-D-muramate 1-phosphate uridylyltransferase
MLLAAGRGERMRPLTDLMPKPLLEVGGRPLIEWQIMRLVGAGISDLVINHAHLGEQLVERLGDGSRLGARISWSAETEPLETAGGIVQALPLLEPTGAPEIVLIASADVWTEFDPARMAEAVGALRSGETKLHLVMVPNPDYHPQGDFAMRSGRLALDGGPRYTFGNIGLYRTDLFHGLPRATVLRLTPYYRLWVDRGWASGELFTGSWFNVGTAEQLAELDRRLSAVG